MTGVAISRGGLRAGDLPSPVRRGLVDVWPVALGLVPFALAIGATIASTGVASVDGLFAGVLVLGGSAQLAGLDLAASGAAVAAIALTIAMVNLRFALYSASFATWFRDETVVRRLVMAAFLIDQNHALCEAAFAERAETDWRRRYYVTITAAMVVVFFAAQAIGIQIGAAVPESWGLHLAGPLVFAGLLAGAARTVCGVAAAVVASAMVMLGASLPNGLSLPVAIVVGAVFALVAGGGR
jgi:predicted branched-subunit amino acid permease